MKTFKEFLTEARQAPLYHSTGVGSAKDIFDSNMMKGKTPQKLPAPISGGGEKAVKGVSLTRDLSMAKNWMPVIFQLDQSKLINNHKVIPFDYFHNRVHMTNGKVDTRKRVQGINAEAEEFVVGDIKNVKKFVTKVWIHRKDYDNSQPARFFIETIKGEWKIPVEVFE